MAKTFSKDDVASHGKSDSLWIVIDEDVYDVSKFQDEHPGKFCLVQLGASDAAASIRRITC
jgi:cytochrome b involved in lipid metabolism